MKVFPGNWEDSDDAKECNKTDSYWTLATWSLPPNIPRNNTVSCSLYEFPISAVKKLPQVGCLEQHKSITLQFYRSKVQSGSPQAKIKGPAGPHSFLEVLEQNQCPCLLASADHLHFLAHGSFSPFLEVKFSLVLCTQKGSLPLGAQGITMDPLR